MMPIQAEKYPGAFSLKPNVSKEIVKMVNDAIAANPGGRTIYYMGFSMCYSAPMWHSGVPLDWYQVCQSLDRRGVDVSHIVAAANRDTGPVFQTS